MSDLHGGSSQVDYALINRELRAARRNGDRVLLGGDVMDLILPQDRRRYSPSAVHPSLRGRDDLVNATVEKMDALLGPYADLIDGVGEGNHETAAKKSSGTDAVRLLVQKLNARRDPALPQIAQLGYAAVISYRLCPSEGARPAARYTVWYHHGAGKVSKAYGALKGLLDKVGSFEADLYWSGHSHARASCSETAYRVERGRLVARDVRCVVTGGYMVPYGAQGTRSTDERGPKGNYASEGGYSPHGMGGARVVLRWDSPGRPDKIEVHQ
jgi:hypothetical protein